MKPDDTVCYCYHVSYRKLVNFARREKPKRASQLSECLGAGTGCGWCIPFLKRIFEAAATDFPDVPIDLAPDEYADARRTYIEQKKPKNTF
jgi:bacterioferritin-associated ferredoxin